MNQKNLFQKITTAIPQRLKSGRITNGLLRFTSTALIRMGFSRIRYNDADQIVKTLLKSKSITAPLDDIRKLQEECRTLFEPEQRLQASPRESILYPFIRITKPHVVLETGCAWGGTAAFILAALKKNDSGKLISIDLPAAETVQMKHAGIKKSAIGALIPAALKDRWDLAVGDSRLLLPKILAEQSADILIHDSLHTTTHQTFEYEVARSLMKEGTIIASDDIRWNNSFAFFLGLHNLVGYAPLENKNFGVTVNAFDPYEKEMGLFR